MQTVEKPITKKVLKALAKGRFGNLVKAVVDIEKGIMCLDASLHADEEAELISTGSQQENLWGINLYPDNFGNDFIEFDSMINVRPNQNNFSRGVEDEATRQKISEIVRKLVK